MKRVTIFAALVFLTLSGVAVRGDGDEGLSAAPASALKARLEQLKLDAVAARDPDEPGRYVAALYVPGIQLLVVSAPYPLPSAMDKKVAAAQYMDVYMDLQGLRDRSASFFVEDMLADGLRPPSNPDLACDTTTSNGAAPVVFNGKWASQQLTQEEYEAKFKRDDERYARMLNVLNTAVARRVTVP